MKIQMFFNWFGTKRRKMARITYGVCIDLSIINKKEESLLQSIADWKQGFYDDVLSGKTAYYSNLVPELRK